MNMNSESDKILILGGGPAGLSCGLWLHHLGCDPLILDRNDQLGGLQTSQLHENIWLLGHRDQTGQQLAEQFADHVTSLDFPCHIGTEIRRIDEIEGESFSAKTVDGNEFHGKAVVLAMGTRPRGPELFAKIPGHELLQDPAVACFQPGNSVSKAPELADQNVCIIGGADNAFKTALFAAEHARHVTILVRSQVTADSYHQRAVHDVMQDGKVTVSVQTKVVRFERGENGLLLHTQNAAEDTATIDADFVFFRTGYAANDEIVSPWIENQRLSTDGGGHLKVDGDMRTTMPRVYAIGDITDSGHPCVATAIAQGTMAARALEKDFRRSLF